MQKDQDEALEWQKTQRKLLKKTGLTRQYQRERMAEK